MFFFWSGLNSSGIDEVDVGFYPEARLRGKTDSYSIRDVVSTRAKVFWRFWSIKSGSRKSAKRRKDYKNKEVSFLLMMSCYYWESLWKFTFKMIQNNINLYSRIKQTTGLSSVRIEFSRISIFSNAFAIINEKIEQLTLPTAVDLSSSNSWLKINPWYPCHPCENMFSRISRFSMFSEYEILKSAPSCALTTAHMLAEVRNHQITWNYRIISFANWF